LVEAAKFFKLSADQHNAAGQYEYGNALYNGEGVTQDLAEAVKYFKLAADQGNAAAVAQLSTL
jgi:TPR repeat protein